MEDHKDETTSVLIVGAGPVGLFLALLLTHSKIPVQIIESSTVVDKSSSRAIVYQPSIYPALMKAGVFNDLKDAGIMTAGISYRATKTGEVIISSPPLPPNAPGILILPQWQFTEILMSALEKVGVCVQKGWNVEHVDSSAADHAEVSAINAEGERTTFKGRYLVGADGGKSTVRKSCGIVFEGETLPSQLIATDVKFPFEKYGWSDTQFMMDTENYGVISKIDNKGLWRVAFSLPKHQGGEQVINQALEDKYSAMFPGPRPMEYEYEVVNVAPYKCRQFCAATMREGRVMLVGDAAHLTNPYAGLGYSSGFFDAASLAEVLISVITRGAADVVLNSWSTARLNIFRKVVDPLSRAAFLRVQDPDLATICDRDPGFKAMKAGKMPMPGLATDVTTLEGYVG